MIQFQDLIYIFILLLLSTMSYILLYPLPVVIRNSIPVYNGTIRETISDC